MQRITVYTPIYAILEGRAGLWRIFVYWFGFVVFALPTGAYLGGERWRAFMPTGPMVSVVLIGSLFVSICLIWIFLRGILPKRYRVGKAFKRFRNPPKSEKLSRKAAIAFYLIFCAGIIIGGFMLFKGEGDWRFVGMFLFMFSILMGAITVGMDASADLKIDTSMMDAAINRIFGDRYASLLAYRIDFPIYADLKLPDKALAIGLTSEGLILKQYLNGHWTESAYSFEYLYGLSIGTGRDLSKIDYACVLLLHRDGRRLHLNLSSNYQSFITSLLLALDAHLETRDPAPLPGPVRVPFTDEQFAYYSEF